MPLYPGAEQKHKEDDDEMHVQPDAYGNRSEQKSQPSSTPKANSTKETTEHDRETDIEHAEQVYHQSDEADYQKPK